MKKDITLARLIGKKIKKFRIKKYPKYGEQKKCAQDFGTSPQQWAKWEAGMVVPEPETLKKLAKFLGVSVKDLRGDTVQPSGPKDLSEDMKGLLAISGNVVLALQHCQTAAASGHLEEFEFAEIIQDLVTVFRKKAEKFNIDNVRGLFQQVG